MSEVLHVTEGHYLLNPGDDAMVVARRCYGDVHKSNVVLGANPGDWALLERVVVPNKRGRLLTFEEGDTPSRLIQRAYPGQLVHQYMLGFKLWNGGDDPFFHVGDPIFIPER